MRTEFVIEARRVVSFGGDPEASVLHVRDGAVIEVGRAELARRAEHAGAQRIRMLESTIMPGFIDAHVHLELDARARTRGIDCGFPKCKSIDDVLQVLSDAEPYKGWLIGNGNLFMDQKLADRRLPTRDELDSVSKTVPIILQCGGHLSVLNSAALDRVPAHVFETGVSGLWGAPRVERDVHGNPTGVVAEIDGHLPLPDLDEDELVTALATTARESYLRYGVTTIGEISDTHQALEILRRTAGTPELPLRVRSYLISPAMGPLEETIGMASRDSGVAESLAGFAISGVKLFADGGFSARNAAATTEYLPDQATRGHDRGRINLPYGTFRRALGLAREAGIQLAVHANGARAQRDILQAVIDSGDPFSHLPVRMEHLGNLLPDFDMLLMIKRAGVTPVMQPSHLYSYIGDFASVVLGDAALRGRLPVRTMLDDGIIPAFSSDDHETDPLFNCEVARGRRSFWGVEIEPWESIGLEEAFRLYTLEAARALRLEDHVGSLAPGKQADFVVYDEDPRDPRNDIRRIRPAAVFIAGRSVLKRTPGGHDDRS